MCPQVTFWDVIIGFIFMVGLSFFSILASVVLLITGIRWQKYGAVANILLVLLANGYIAWACAETESPQGPLMFLVFNLLVSLPVFIAQLFLMASNDIERRRQKNSLSTTVDQTKG